MTLQTREKPWETPSSLAWDPCPASRQGRAAVLSMLLLGGASPLVALVGLSFLDRGGVRLRAGAAPVLLPWRRAVCGPRWFNTSDNDRQCLLTLAVRQALAKDLLLSISL